MIPFERYKTKHGTPFPTPPWFPYPPVHPLPAPPPAPWLPYPSVPVSQPFPRLVPSPQIGPRWGAPPVAGMSGLGASANPGIWERLNVWVSNTLSIDYGVAQGVSVAAIVIVGLIAFKAVKR